MGFKGDFFSPFFTGSVEATVKPGGGEAESEATAERHEADTFRECLGSTNRVSNSLFMNST